MLETIAALLAALSVTAGGAGADTGYIFMGDSRMVGMEAAVGELPDDTFVVAEVAKGYSWMMSDGFAEAADIIKSHPEYENWSFVMNFGVNDLGNAEKYAEAYSQLSESADVYALTVNPCSGSYAKLNDSIEAFNDKMQDTDGIICIDTCSGLVHDGFGSRDGLHYDKDTYVGIYDFVDSILAADE